MWPVPTKPGQSRGKLFSDFQKYKMLKIQASKWYITCHICSIFSPWKIDISLIISFVFYWFVKRLLPGSNFLSVLATLSSFRGNRSQICFLEWELHCRTLKLFMNFSTKRCLLVCLFFVCFFVLVFLLFLFLNFNLERPLGCWPCDKQINILTTGLNGKVQCTIIAYGQNAMPHNLGG